MMAFRKILKPASRSTAIETLDDERSYHLLHGTGLLTSGFGKDRAAFEAAWRTHRDSIRPTFIAANPGRRPFAEWLTEIVPKHGERPFLRPAPPFVKRKFGIFHSSVWRVDPQGNRDHVQQPEEIFLAQHGLLEPGELEQAKERLANDRDPGRFVWPDDL